MRSSLKLNILSNASIILVWKELSRTNCREGANPFVAFVREECLHSKPEMLRKSQSNFSEKTRTQGNLKIKVPWIIVTK